MRSSRVAAVAVLAATLGLAGCAAAAEPEMPDIPSMSDEQVEAERLASADSAWELALFTAPDAARPEVEMVRFVAANEQLRAVFECMEAEGYDVTWKGDTFELLSSEGIRASAAVAQYSCFVKYPTDPRLSQPLSAAELDYLYDWYTSVQAPCFAAEGHEIAEAPSRQSFADNWQSASAWKPITEIADLPRKEYERVLAACGESPENFRGGAW
jgi:hypothetical protein